jgi:hypothetical protein
MPEAAAAVSSAMVGGPDSDVVARDALATRAGFEEQWDRQRRR